MKMKDTTRRSVRFLFSIRRYLIFFLLMAFVITCCMILFLNMMTRATGFELTQKYIEQAAKVTFLNVALLSLLCTVIDGIRRRIMVKRPVKRIVSAAEQIMKGDFSVRIPSLRSADKMSGFDVIADYFNQMAEELSGTETLRTDFIANVSHEFKTPLTAIEGYAALLRNRELTEKQRKDYLDKIAGNARKLSELTGNILWLSKLENQSVIPNKKYYRLDEQIRKTVLSLENEWSVKHLDFDIALPKTDFFGNEGLLYHVWFNLIGNAIKFSHENQTVKISMEEADGEVVVVIADSGCGMEEEAQRHIFEKFYQADKSHAKEGNGLGLTLVKRIVDLCNGHIAVESQLKKGSVFIVRLPTK